MDREGTNQLPKAVCGDCVAFRTELRDEMGRVLGKCRLRLEIGVISHDLLACHLLQIRTDRIDKVELPKTKIKSGRRTHARAVKTYSTRTKVRILRDPILGDTHGEIQMDRDGLKQVLRELLEEETLYGYPEMGGRWEEGTLILKPANTNLQPKEVPLKTFFHKIVMLRDRLRVLEAKINASEKLDGQDKLELQGFISKCYGTLTTFNILFADRSDHFKSR